MKIDIKSKIRRYLASASLGLFLLVNSSGFINNHLCFIFKNRKKKGPKSPNHFTYRSAGNSEEGYKRREPGDYKYRKLDDEEDFF